MKIRNTVKKALEPLYMNNPAIRQSLMSLDGQMDRLHHSVARFFPGVIKPDPRTLFIALTADCNYRCKGCHYGREFMHGKQLPWPLVRDLLDDAKSLGFESVRLYGGEPLIYKHLPRVVAHATGLGMHTWVTTNGFLLKDKIDELYAAGLRDISLGFYGIGEEYDRYTQSNRGFARMEEGLAYVREHYGLKVSLFLDWLLMRPTCDLASLHKTWHFARKYHTPIWVNLFHYSLPYFITDREHELQFRPEDRPRIEALVTELLNLREQQPGMFPQRVAGLRAIPDWLVKGPEMQVPCERYRLIWVGADGTVQMCYVTFKLGNLHEKRLRDMLFTNEHYRAARDAFQLKCPNCHCGFDKRTVAHAPSYRKYSKPCAAPAAEGELGKLYKVLNREGR